MSKIFCVDIGGTKTAFACFDEQGNELFYDLFETRPSEGAERLVERVYERVKTVVNGVSFGVIASPGPLNGQTGEIEYIATMGWKNVPIVKLFEEKFGFAFSLLNDCDAGGLGVWKYGGFAEYQNLCYMSISTGIGGGGIVNGSLLTGKGNGANFGHIPVLGEGLQCGCGEVDCLELYASGSGMEKRYLAKTGKKLVCAEIAECARNGEKNALEIFQTASEKLIFALKIIVATLDPEIVVLGGSVCKSADLFLPTLQKALPALRIEYAPTHGKQVLYGALAYGLMK